MSSPRLFPHSHNPNNQSTHRTHFHLAQSFPIHQQSQEEEKEAAKKWCSFVLGESVRRVCLNGKKMTKNWTCNSFYFEALRRDPFNHAQILEEVYQPCRLPSMAKSGPDQLLLFKLMLGEHSCGTLRS